MHIVRNFQIFNINTYIKSIVGIFVKSYIGISIEKKFGEVVLEICRFEVWNF